MPEFEELQLQVSFVDNATPQLRALLGEVNKMSDLTSRASQGFREVSESTRRFGTELSQVSKLLTDITKLPIGTLLGAGGIAGIAYGIKAMNDQLAVFSREMLNLQNNSRIAGILPDQFKSVSTQLTQVGYSAEEANSEIIRFYRTVDEAGRAGTAQFQKIYQEAWNPTVMLQHIQRLRDMIKSGDGAKALEEAGREGQRIFERELTKPGGSRAEATRQQEAYYESVGLSMKAGNIKSLQDIAGDPEKWQKRITAAAAFNREYSRFGEITEDIGAEMKTTLLPAFEDLNTWLVTTSGSWAKWIPEQLKVELGTIRSIVLLLSGDLKGFAQSKGGGVSVKPGSMADILLQGKGGEVQGPPTAYGQQPIDPTNPTGVQAPSGAELTQEQSERLGRRYRGRTRQGGGPVEGGQSYIVGEKGPEIFVPRSSGTVMANLGGGGGGGDLETSKQKEIIEDETDQRRALTTNLKQINDMLESGDIDLRRAGTGAGAGAGYGRAGAGPGTPSRGTPGTGTGTGTPGSGGPYPAGTHGGPGGPPITPLAPGGTTPATLPGSVAPIGYPTGGGFTPVQDLTTATGQPAVDATGGTAGTVDRSSLAEQVKDPAMVQRLMALSDAEVGGNKDPQARLRFLAGHMNRTLIESGNVNKQIWNGYYPGITTNQLNKKYTPQQIADFRKNVLDPVMAGAGGTHTHNASNAPGNPVAANAERKYPGQGKWIGNEYFYTKTGEQGRLGRYVRKEDTTGTAAPAITTLKTRPTEPGQQAAIPPELTTPTRMAPSQPTTQQGTASGGGYGGDVKELQSKVAGIRKGALDPQVRNALSYASSQTGLTVEVGSGGQPTSGPNRTGSHRHDLGMAADFKLRDKDGKLVAINDPRAIEFYRNAARAGMAGGGAAAGYMGMYTTHLDPGHKGGVYAGSREFREAIAAGQREYKAQGMPPLPTRSQVAGPGAGSGVGATPNITTLKTRPDTGVNPFTFDRQQQDDRGDMAAGKNLGRGFLGGVAAGKPGSATFLNRQGLDRMQGQGIFHRVRGRGSVDVTINKSEGSRSTPIAGPFKKIRMHGQRQNEHASSGAPEPTAANHDPGLDS